MAGTAAIAAMVLAVFAAAACGVSDDPGAAPAGAAAENNVPSRGSSGPPATLEPEQVAPPVEGAAPESLSSPSITVADALFELIGGPAEGASTTAHEQATATLDSRFEPVSAGWDFACRVGAGGAVACWGDNVAGQGEAPGRGEFVSVSAGGTHACGLRDDGFIGCWGDDRYGQIDAPRGEFVSITAGSRHACGLRGDGSVECWGDNTQR